MAVSAGYPQEVSHAPGAASFAAGGSGVRGRALPVRAFASQTVTLR